MKRLLAVMLFAVVACSSAFADDSGFVRKLDDATQPGRRMLVSVQINPKTHHRLTTIHIVDPAAVGRVPAFLCTDKKDWGKFEALWIKAKAITPPASGQKSIEAGKFSVSGIAPKLSMSVNSDGTISIMILEKKSVVTFILHRDVNGDAMDKIVKEVADFYAQ
jgi:hypothetical protein